jgi:starch-binding outer membrane protein, SusD/RagB family
MTAMRHAWKMAATVALALGAAGCNDFLSGNGVSDDPNNISKLTRPGPLYIGIQAAQGVQFQGQLARDAVMYVQQISGNSRQQIGFDRYAMDPVTIDPNWTSVYGSNRTLNGGGGLLDIRKMQQLARAVGDSLYIGIGKVYEALVIGTAADVWGDVPYREAADSNNATPAFDPQLQIYADLQAQLDSAINIYLPAGGATNLGPPQDNAELIYAGRDAAGLSEVYTQVAHSLKARFYMHTAEVDPSSYALALAEVPLGINGPANDFNWFADATPNGNNIWLQFQATRGDIAPGAAMVEIMKRRIDAGLADDARLNFYFVPAADDAGDPLGFFGYRPAGTTNLQTAPGIDPGNGIVPPGGSVPSYSGFNFIDPNVDLGDFRQPEVTYVETQLIGAEAAFQGGGQGAAQPFLDAARANRGYGARGATVNVFPALGTAPATLENIMEEKYVAQFLNIEAWNDWKRTCLPALAPTPAVGSTAAGTTPIAGRMPYGITEINANPNTPNVAPAGRNANDPNPCPVLNYTSSAPLAN